MAVTNLKVVKSTTTQPARTLEHITQLRPSDTQTPTFSIEDLVGAHPISQSEASNPWQYVADSLQYTHDIKSIVANSAIFHSCLQKWKEETKFTSSLMEIIMHPSYQRIIGLGPVVIPFVLQELSENGGHWFWALQSLTGENPVPMEDQGRTRKMAEAWFQWGKQKQFI